MCDKFVWHFLFPAMQLGDRSIVVLDGPTLDPRLKAIVAKEEMLVLEGTSSNFYWNVLSGCIAALGAVVIVKASKPSMSYLFLMLCGGLLGGLLGILDKYVQCSLAKNE